MPIKNWSSRYKESIASKLGFDWQKPAVAIKKIIIFTIDFIAGL